MCGRCSAAHDFLAKPEGSVAVALTVELTPGLRLHHPGTLVLDEGEDRPVAIGPDLKRVGFSGDRTVAGLGIDRHDRPGLVRCNLALARKHIGERLRTF